MKDEKQKKEKQAVSPALVPKFRYVCDGCTNDAIVSTNQMIGVVVECMACKKVQVTKPENWIAL